MHDDHEQRANKENRLRRVVRVDLIRDEVTAIGALIVDESGVMLFIVRGKHPGEGKLGLPGGFVDTDEAAERLLVRKIEEKLHPSIVHYEYLADASSFNSRHVIYVTLNNWSHQLSNIVVTF